jgi:hypothetical protein
MVRVLGERARNGTVTADQKLATGGTLECRWRRPTPKPCSLIYPRRACRARGGFARAIVQRLVKSAWLDCDADSSFST